MAAPTDASATSRPVLRIGITGHRRHRLRVPDDALLQRIGEVIATVRATAGARAAGPVEIVSALAEGADEMAARVALRTGCRLTALVPFAPADYESTFSDKGHVASFRALLKRAHKKIVLPGSLRRANAGYEAVGLATLDRSDLVLTIWDGAPAQGRGGTPDILQAALQRRLPIVWIDATIDRPLRLLQRKASGPCPQLANAARRAPALRPRDLAQIVAAAARGAQAAGTTTE